MFVAVNATTLIESRTENEINAAVTRSELLGFVLLWSFDEPERVGEIVLMPSHEIGTCAVLGRHTEEFEHHGPPRLMWMRQQPGRNQSTGALRSRTISRVQLQIQVRGPDLLRVTNLGRAPLLHEGRVVDAVAVAPGDCIELRKRALFMCIRRPLCMPVSEPPVALGPFGEADEHGIAGESPAAWELRSRISFIAGRRTHVLVRGPSGTGKELVAQAIHRMSPRGDRAMVSRNAATFPETLIDAELFGNARGFPNPGMPERPGLVGAAHGTTLFLDEFAELPQALQAHLLRVLDQGEYTRLGEAEARQSDFRLIAATNRPEDMLKHDVLARLRLRLEIPGLEQRREDIPLIARHIMRELARDDADIARRYFPDGDPSGIPQMSCALVRHLVHHTYTTHVRELETMLWRAMSHSLGNTLELWHLGARRVMAPLELIAAEVESDADAYADDIGEEPTEPMPGHRRTRLPSSPCIDPLSISPDVIQACLDRHGGRQEPAWRELGLSSRHVLTRLVRKYNLLVRGRG